MLFSRKATTATVASSALFASTFFVAATANLSPVSTDNEGGDADAGILMVPSSSSSSSGVGAAAGEHLGIFGGGRELAGLCTQGYIDCVDGYLASDPTTSCTAACYDDNAQAYNCCSGDACHGVTGKICQDGSCAGPLACDAASIPIIVNSCKGDRACQSVGYLVCGGPANKVGNFINSCNAYKACYYAASGAGGGMGGLENSCTADQACQRMGAGAYGPVTSNLKDCCTASLGCYQYAEASIPAQCKVVVSLQCCIIPYNNA